MTELKCKLCGETFDANDFEVSNTNGELLVRCPNGCLLNTYYIGDYADIEEIKK